ncbi:hypothetical protein T07_13871, partial [Trichinella nelsoni]
MYSPSCLFLILHPTCIRSGGRGPHPSKSNLVLKPCPPYSHSIISMESLPNPL